ncbi:MAG: hypothetical protein Q8904_12840 [Bacteroidota bacterium]|nr:hypothetical protein [Bacteroidota bacterium]
MKPYIFLNFLFFAFMLTMGTAYAQQQDSLKQKQIKFYSRVLTVGQETATQVASIMDTYKEGVKKVVADATLTEDARRAKIDELIDEKNKKFELLLTPAQQAKIIPTTERKKNKPGK